MHARALTEWGRGGCSGDTKEGTRSQDWEGKRGRPEADPPYGHTSGWSSKESENSTLEPRYTEVYLTRNIFYLS